MIAKLTGKILEVEPAHLVLDVSGVGYLLSITSSSGYETGDTVSLHTHLAVRENALDLYGFKEKEELTMFYHLVKIPKIGPKTALQILSQSDLVTLKKAVYTEDPSYLTKMSGIGKKGAENIVAGLKGKLPEEDFDDNDIKSNETDADVVDALITLGYSQRDALQALQSIPEDILGTNERIKYTLRELSK